MSPVPVCLEAAGLYDAVCPGKDIGNKKTPLPVKPGRLDLLPAVPFDLIQYDDRKPEILCKREYATVFQHRPCLSHSAAFSKREMCRPLVYDGISNPPQHIGMCRCRKRVVTVEICLECHCRS